MTGSEVQLLEVSIPIETFDESVSRFWFDQPDNKNLDELQTTIMRNKRLAAGVFKNPLDE